MCPIRVRIRTKAVRVNTAVPCADEASHYVSQMVLGLRPQRGILGALGDIAGDTGISFWKLRKLWNPSLQRHGFTWEADEHRSLKQTYQQWFLDQRDYHKQQLARIEQLEAELNPPTGEQQIALGI